MTGLRGSMGIVQGDGVRRAGILASREGVRREAGVVGAGAEGRLTGSRVPAAGRDRVGRVRAARDGMGRGNGVILLSGGRKRRLPCPS
jgi:hypothetical protein